jgi:hypothetical protein
MSTPSARRLACRTARLSWTHGGNDFPHPESTYPNSNEVLDALLPGVADADAVAITSGNAQRLFGFDETILASQP